MSLPFLNIEVLKLLEDLNLFNTYAVLNNFKFEAGILNISSLYELIRTPFSLIMDTLKVLSSDLYNNSSYFIHFLLFLIIPEELKANFAKTPSNNKKISTKKTKATANKESSSFSESIQSIFTYGVGGLIGVFVIRVAKEILSN